MVVHGPFVQALLGRMPKMQPKPPPSQRISEPPNHESIRVPVRVLSQGVSRRLQTGTESTNDLDGRQL